MSYFVVEIPSLHIAYVINHPPRRSDQIVGAAETADEAWALFDAHEKRRQRREAVRDYALLAVLAGAFVLAGVVG